MKRYCMMFVGLALLGCGDDIDVMEEERDLDAFTEFLGEAVNACTLDRAVTVVPTVYAIGNDQETGTLAKIDVASLKVESNLIPEVASSDTVLDYEAGKLFVIDRLKANISIVSPGEKTELIKQFSVGEGTNPQGVAVSEGKIFVALFGAGYVLVVDEKDPNTEIARIDLSAFDEADGVPNANSILAADGRIYVSLGLLDASFTSAGGKVVVIDPARDSVVADVDLKNTNPFGPLVKTSEASAFGGDLLVETVPDFSKPTEGCIERVKLGNPPTAGGCAITNEDIGGYVSAIASCKDSTLLAVTDSSMAAGVVSVAAGGEVKIPSKEAKEIAGPTDLILCPSGHVVLNDPQSGGIRIFAPEGKELTERPLDIGQPASFSGGLVCI